MQNQSIASTMGGATLARVDCSQAPPRGTLDFVSAIRERAYAIRSVAADLNGLVRGNAPMDDSIRPCAPGLNGDLGDILDILADVEQDLRMTHNCMCHHDAAASHVGSSMSVGKALSPRR